MVVKVWLGKCSLTIGTNAAKTISFDTGSANYITKIYGTDPQSTNNDVYVYKNFKDLHSGNGFDANVSMSIVSASTSNGEDFTNDYSVATTPYIVSQLVGSANKNLFKLKTRSHGTDVNDDFKIAIADLTAAGSVPGSDYGSFSLKVLKNNPGETDDGEVLEEFTNINFDPDSQNYLPRQIGDRYVTIDSNGKLTYNGDWQTNQFIFTCDYATQLEVSMNHYYHMVVMISNPILGTTTIQV